MFKKITAVILALYISVCMAIACEAKGIKNPEIKTYQKTAAAARETLWKAVTAGEGAGASIAVMDNGRIVFSEGFGVKDWSLNNPVDKNTRFNIGSTSKMFVATAILMLVDEGKLKLDDAIVKYIPDFKMKDERYKDITVRMIFNHSSGLPGSTFDVGYKPYYDMHKLLLETLADEHLKHAPGAMSMYCNDGFTLAEIIVENVSGKKFIDFISGRIFKPLGMKHTGLSVGEVQDPDTAQYYDIKGGKKYPLEVLTVYAAGGLSSTLEDLCRFGNSFTAKGKKLLSPSSIKEIRKTQPTLFSDKLQNRQMMAEFGWEYVQLSPYDEKGIQVMGKGGNSLCYSSNLQIAPDENMVIAVCISGHASGEALTRPVLDALMREKKLISPADTHAAAPPEAQEIPAEFLKYSGFYTGETKTVKIAVDQKNKKVDIYLPAGKNDKDTPPVASLIYNNGYLFNTAENIQCYFTDIDGKSYLVLYKMPPYGVDSLLYQKLDEIKNPVRLKTDIDGKIWLVRNASPYILAGGVELPVSKTYKDLSGYVDFGGLKKIESPVFASIAATCFRDQAELNLIDKNGETWLKSSNYLFSTADGARKAANGENIVTIKADNYNEWLKLEKGAILNFSRPKGGRIIVLTPDKGLFDSIVDAGEIYAPAGSFIFCAGKAGDVFKINKK